MYCKIPPGGFDRYVISCDYGTVNPTSAGLWGRQNGIWYRIDEYYFDSRSTGFQRTDEEHYEALCRLAGDRRVDVVVADPSAASFIEVIRRHRRFAVKPADNNVVNGIRRVSQALKDGSVKICENCRDARREFSLYKWDSARREDAPVKEHDHAMDDIRYFVTTAMDGGRTTVAIAAGR